MSAERVVQALFVGAVVSLAGCSSPTAPGGSVDGFVTSGNIELRWFLDLPDGAGPFPAIVYGQGSGSVTAHLRHTVESARELNELGYAVLTYDKRGTGESGGEMVDLNTANSETLIAQLADDMEAVLGVLASRPEIDSSQIGLYGISQANWYMPLVAERRPEVRFMIVVSGGPISVGLNNYYESLTQYDVANIEGAHAQLDGYDGPVGFNPVPHIRALTIPLFYLLGTDDANMPSLYSFDELTALRDEGESLDALLYDGGGHGLRNVDFWPDLRAWLEGI